MFCRIPKHGVNDNIEYYAAQYATLEKEFSRGGRISSPFLASLSVHGIGGTCPTLSANRVTGRFWPPNVLVEHMREIFLGCHKYPRLLCRKDVSIYMPCADVLARIMNKRDYLTNALLLPLLFAVIMR